MPFWVKLLGYPIFTLGVFLACFVLDYVPEIVKAHRWFWREWAFKGRE